LGRKFIARSKKRIPEHHRLCARHLLHGAPKDSGFATDYLHDTLLGLAMISIRVFMA
jgi:hypothetical protein